MVTQHTYDWSQTQRKLVILIPNFGRREYVEATIARTRTRVPEDGWVFLVANDGIHEDFEHLRPHNVSYFTFVRDPATPRNGALIRNYVLKRLRCERVVQRDPEIWIDGDYIQDAVEAPAGSRLFHPNATLSLGREATIEVLGRAEARPGELCRLMGRHGLRFDVRTEPHWGFHWGSVLPVALLRELRGYDEEFTEYGFEDTDLVARLRAIGLPLGHHGSSPVVHFWHPICDDAQAQAGRMYQVFRGKSPFHTRRNPSSWGEGV